MRAVAEVRFSGLNPKVPGIRTINPKSSLSSTISEKDDSSILCIAYQLPLRWPLSGFSNPRCALVSFYRNTWYVFQMCAYIPCYVRPPPIPESVSCVRKAVIVSTACCSSYQPDNRWCMLYLVVLLYSRSRRTENPSPICYTFTITGQWR